MNIEEQIRRAMEDGQFNNLPGKGKPFNFDENAFEDPEWRMANKILKDGGFSLPWIESRKEIEAEQEAASDRLKRAWKWRQGGLAANQPRSQVEAEWQRAEAAFREKIAAVNRLIFSYNLAVPSSHFQCLVIDVEREIEKCKEEGKKESTG